MFKYRLITVSAAALCLALVCAFLFTGHAQASPAAPVELTLTQPDGTTTFTARQWGDEYNNGIETVEGYSILQTGDGWWVYAELKSDGYLGPVQDGSGLRRVGIDSSEGLAPHARATVLNENPHSPAAMGLTSPALRSPEAPTLVNLKTLVLLADFNDVTPTYTAASFQSLMFSTGSGSVRDFYRDASFNNLDIVPAEETCGTSNDGITNWTDLGYAHPNTGSSTGTANYDLVYNVLVANNGCINFANFDTNANGYIETSELTIIVVVAGYERSYSTDTPNIWAHQGWLNWGTNGLPVLDGKTIGDYYNGGNYAQFGERHGGHQATIGIMAHEFGHVINWPDLYDTDNSSEGVGNWSIMGSGSWNFVTTQGDSPAFPDAWLKWYQGWITPTTVSGTLTDQAIAQAETNQTAYLLRPNPSGIDWLFQSHSGTGEFFLVENRQNNSGAGYDDGLPGCGLLIWHVDESVTYTNSANANESRPLVKLMEADGLNDLYNGTDRGDTGDPYPGSTSNYNFNSGTNPNSNLYGGSASNVSVHVDSTSCSSSMQADLTYTLPGPGAFSKTTPANTAMGQPTSLILDWADSSGAASYDYCVDAFADGSCAGSWYSTGSTSQVGPLSFSGGLTYEWQVRANDGVGGTTYANSGVTWTFTTTSVTLNLHTYLPLVQATGPLPLAFSKTTPANAATGIPTAPTLDWADATFAVSYEYCYDSSVNGSCSGSWVSSGAASQASLGGLAVSTAYEWQVRARNSSGLVSYANSGTLWSFTTAAAGTSWTVITSEDFETAIPKTGWSATDLSSSDMGDYKMGQRACNVNSGSYSGWLVGGGTNGSALGCGASYVTNHNSWFVYGPFSTVGATAAQLNYNFYTNTESCCDAFWVTASDDNTNYWGTWRSGSYAWAGDSFDLNQTLCGNGTTSCLGKANVWIAFSFDSDSSVQYAYGANVDNIVLRKCTTGSCTGAPPLGPTSPLASPAVQDFLQPFLLQLKGFGSQLMPH